MTQKPFGVKQLNVIGAAGTPTIESAGDLNIGGQQVAITTNTSIAGVITATAFSGDGSQLTGVGVPANLTATTLNVSGVSTFQSNVYLGDNDKIILGNGEDLQIYHNGVSNIVEDVGTGGLTLRGNNIYLQDDSSGGYGVFAQGLHNGAFELYYDNSKKLETTGAGISITGGVEATGVSTFQGNVNLGDNDILTLGTSGLSIWWQNYTNIQNNTGRLDINQYAANENINLTAYGSSAFLGVRVEGSTGESQLYHTGDRKLNTTGYGVSITGVCTATSFNINSTTGDGSDRGFTTKYYITASGSPAYRFAGPGVLNSTDNPTLYFHRGFTYILENSTGSGHPFELRVSSGGAAYAPGGSFLTGSINGTQILTVPFDGPSSIVYQCTIHGGMLGTINFVS